MIPKRITEKFKVVVLHDPALLEVFSYEELSQYHMAGCDISKLELERCKIKPSIFHCEPLQTKYHYILDSMEGGLPTSGGNPFIGRDKSKPAISLSTAWQLFKRHVKKADNYLNGNDPILTFDDGGEIEDKCLEDIDNDTLVYVAQAILWKAGNIKAVFTVPGTLLADITRYQFQRVKDAEQNPVKD